jgi:hypothetical protein
MVALPLVPLAETETENGAWSPLVAKTNGDWPVKSTDGVVADATKTGALIANERIKVASRVMRFTKKLDRTPLNARRCRFAHRGEVPWRGVKCRGSRPFRALGQRNEFAGAALR